MNESNSVVANRFGYRLHKAHTCCSAFPDRFRRIFQVELLRPLKGDRNGRSNDLTNSYTRLTASRTLRRRLLPTANSWPHHMSLVIWAEYREMAPIFILRNFPLRSMRMITFFIVDLFRSLWQFMQYTLGFPYQPLGKSKKNTTENKRLEPVSLLSGTAHRSSFGALR